MQFHTDIFNRGNGDYNQLSNSQHEDIPAIIYSFGDNRVLKWCRRHDTNGKWQKQCPDWSYSISLISDSIAIINPNDERPTPRDGNPYNTQYQHGNVSVTQNKLSFVLIFRVIDTVGGSDVNYRLVNHNIDQ